MLKNDQNNAKFCELSLITRNTSKSDQVISHLIPEFVALTLLPNKYAVEALKTIFAKTTNSNQLDIPNQANSFNKLMNQNDFKCINADFASPAVRNIFRTNILNLCSKHYKSLNELKVVQGRSVEHITLRAYPVLYETPQSTGRIGKRIIFVVYNLKRHWIFAHVAELAESMVNKEIDELEITPKIVAKGAWHNLVDDINGTIQIACARESQPTRYPTPIFLHLPKNSNLSSKLKRDNWQVFEDMPALYPGKKRLKIEFFKKNSKVINEFYQPKSCTYGLRSLPIDITELPNLSKLNHATKDELIKNLWHEINYLKGFCNEPEKI